MELRTTIDNPKKPFAIQMAMVFHSIPHPCCIVLTPVQHSEIINSDVHVQVHILRHIWGWTFQLEIQRKFHGVLPFLLFFWTSFEVSWAFFAFVVCQHLLRVLFLVEIPKYYSWQFSSFAFPHFFCIDCQKRMAKTRQTIENQIIVSYTYFFIYCTAMSISCVILKW